MKYMVKYSVIIPIFNEELVIQELYSRLKKVMDAGEGDYELVFVNDGSADSSPSMIKNFARRIIM